VLLKREPLGSQREEFFNLGRKFASGRNCEGKAVKKKLKFIFLLVYSTHKKLHSEFSLNGNIYSTQAQAASTSSFESVLEVHCLAALHLWADIAQTIDCLMNQIRPCDPWGSRWVGHWKTTCSTI